MIGKKEEKQKSRLATQIRISYMILILPSIIFMVFAFIVLWTVNNRYKKMLSSVVIASEISLDFKNDFDYETYLLLVGNTTPDKTTIPQQLDDARKVIDGLKDYTTTDDNQKRLQNAEKYLNNLESYIEKIKENLGYENKYEDNMLIWENDVQIVTSLFQETMNEYIYYENRQIQTAQEKNNRLFAEMVEVSIVIFAISIGSIIVVSSVGPVWITRPIEEQVKEEQKQLRKAEFELLQAQINPHFLYNTLDAIVWSAESGNQKQVVNMVGNLSDFFRLSLNRGKETVLVSEEINHVRSYLEIQQIRYQDILKFHIDIPESMNGYKMPKLTVQPIVENALYHGIKNKRGGGSINVSGYEQGDSFTLVVKDDGIGMTEERLADVRKAIEEGTSDKNIVYGLYNVNERIKLNYGEGYGVNIDSKHEEGTTVTIRLPKNFNLNR